MTHDLPQPEVVPDLWKDNIWDRLLDSLAERSVIPIVGPDLLQVEVEGTTTLLNQHVARRLAQTYHLPADNLPAERPLNFVVCQLLRQRKDRYGICDDIFQIMKETVFRPSRTLRQLAEITDLNLFVSTTFSTCGGRLSLRRIQPARVAAPMLLCTRQESAFSGCRRRT
jgi:hypothetical protein